MTAEVPGVTWVGADATNYRPRPQGVTPVYRLIVIHITSGHADPQPVAEMWQQPGHGTSAHFVIGQDGTILQCVSLLMAAQHAHDANAYSIGIEHCAREPGELGASDAGLPPAQAQYEASANLVAYLLKAAGLTPSPDTIKGHRDADPKTTHTGCPDAAPWNWPLYMDLVQAAFAQLGPSQGGA